MGEVIDPTLVVYSYDEPGRNAEAEAGIARVAAHYQAIAHEPLVRTGWSAGRAGVACLHDPAFRRAWPPWAEGSGVAIASGYVPVGWERLVGSLDPEKAAPTLAVELLSRPERAAVELNAPTVLVLVDTRVERIVILNDRLGAGRLYEMAFPGGRVWSNRVGALPLFAGTEVRASSKGWAMLAANGWFMRDTTPLEGASKVPPASILEISAGGIERRRTAAAASLIGSGETLQTLAERFAEEATQTMRTAGLLFSEPARIDLSGGRDSRVSAAAAIAAGIPAQFRTSDVNPGEADIATELMALAPGAHDHKVAFTGNTVKERGADLRTSPAWPFRVTGSDFLDRSQTTVELAPPLASRRPPRGKARARIGAS